MGSPRAASMEPCAPAVELVLSRKDSGGNNEGGSLKFSLTEAVDELVLGTKDSGGSIERGSRKWERLGETGDS